MVPLPQQSAFGLRCMSPAQLYEDRQYLGSIKAIGLISADAGRLNLISLLQIELPRNRVTAKARNDSMGCLLVKF